MSPDSAHETSPERQLAGFLSKYTPDVRDTAAAALGTLRRRLPGAVEFVYDKANSLVVGFGPTERPSDAIFSIIVYPRWVSLCFLAGAGLDDPDGILKGSGHVVRHVVLEPGATNLEQPPVRRLIHAALADADPPMKRAAAGTRGPILIRRVSTRHRSR